MPRLLCAVVVLLSCVAYRLPSGRLLGSHGALRSGGDSVPQLNNTAVKLAWSKNYAGALQLLLRASTGRPSDTVQYNKALILSRLKRYEEASGILETIPAFQHAQANQGILFCLNGDPQAGLSLMERASGDKESADKLAFNKAVAYLYTRQYAEAGRAADDAIRIRGGEPVYRMVKGDALLAQGKYREALGIYQSLSRQTTLAAGLPVRLGNALLGLKRFDEAAELLEEYLLSGDRTQQAAARYALGNAYYGQKEFSKAVAEYRRAVQFQPQSVLAHTGLGNALCSLRDYKTARVEYETALALEPNSPYPQLGLGVVSYRQGLYEQALERFDQSRDLFDDKERDLADCFLSRGLTYLETNALDSARANFAVTVRLNRDHPTAYAGLSEVYRKKDSHRYALEFLEKAISRSPQSDRMLTNKGNLYLKAGNMDEAYSSFSWALHHNARSVNALNGLSIALLEKDRLDKAQYLLDSLIGRGIHKAFLYNNRGIVRSYLALKAEKQNDQHQARQYYYRSIRDYERARDLDSTHKAYFNNLGNVYKNTQEYARAAESYQGHLDKSAINNMGVLFACDRKETLSRHYLNIAIDLDSANLVYNYNRLKVYGTFFKDSLAKRPDITRWSGLLPTNSISAKYSRDGYINIYLYDYDFDHYDFPGDPYFPIQLDAPTPPDYRPLDELVMMAIRRDPGKVRAPEPVRAVVSKMPRSRKVKFAGSTRCPKLF